MTFYLKWLGHRSASGFLWRYVAAEIYATTIPFFAETVQKNLRPKYVFCNGKKSIPGLVGSWALFHTKLLAIPIYPHHVPLSLTLYIHQITKTSVKHSLECVFGRGNLLEKINYLNIKP